MEASKVLILLFFVALCSHVSGLDIDSNGYIMYCPCMGRFGNQADHFLGVLSFAHHMNRTLVLPPWVEYRPTSRKSIQIPFDTYFKVDPLRQRAKVITMEQFMRDLAPIIWPPPKRTVFCYSARHGGKSNDCNAKDGNPFGPFWDTFNIDFVKSEFYGPISYDVSFSGVKKQWDEKYPAKDHMVLAFTGAPASFPVTQQDAGNQKYLQWSKNINRQAEKFIKENIPERPFLGVHMRNGVDWVRACEHATSPQTRNLFGSANCLGYNLEHGQLSKELCLPPDDKVIKQVKKAVKKLKAKSVFIATDDRDLIPQFQKEMKKVKFVRMSDPQPHVDLAILGKADHYIGNCVSTFAAFAIRDRKVRGKSVEYWTFESKTKGNKDEL